MRSSLELMYLSGAKRFCLNHNYHIETENLTGYTLIVHIKQNRSDSDNIDETSHYSRDLFPDIYKN